MSGREESWGGGDGGFYMRSDLVGHANGKLSCPDSVNHSLRFENYQLCELRVSWTSSADGQLLSYAAGPQWTGEVVVAGASKPRRQRREEREAQLQIAALPADLAPPQHRDLRVVANLQMLDRKGDPQGPQHDGWSVLHQLELR